MKDLSKLNEQEKQIYYRDARHKGYYGEIWTQVGKCVFCDLREKYVIYEESGMVLVVSLYAYIDGDIMIVSRRHIASSSDMTHAEWEATRKLMHMGRKLIRKVYDIKGVNFVQRHGGAVAQSTVGHYHIKVIPFDAPDLVTWNYRELRYTPLENAQKIKSKKSYITEVSSRFDKKYSSSANYVLFTVKHSKSHKVRNIILRLKMGNDIETAKQEIAKKAFDEPVNSINVTKSSFAKTSDLKRVEGLESIEDVDTVILHIELEVRYG